MPEPVFTERMQIGSVVRGLDATVRRYVEDYGIGPWTFFEADPEEATDLHEHGRAAASATLCATTKVGSVWWEVFEPRDEEGIFARFLAGEGVHHIAVKTDDYEGALAMQTEPLPLTGTFVVVPPASDPQPAPESP